MRQMSMAKVQEALYALYKSASYYGVVIEVQGMFQSCHDPVRCGVDGEETEQRRMRQYVQCRCQGVVTKSRKTAFVQNVTIRSPLADADV
jgi:hypothetical protein